MLIKALTGFDHHGLRRAGDVFAVSEQTGAELIAAGLCALVQTVQAAETAQAAETGQTAETGQAAETAKKKRK